MSVPQGLLVENMKIVTGLAPTTPSTSSTDWVSMKNYDRCTVIILADNGTAVTGSAISMDQATDVSGTSSKTLSFSTVWANTDTGASDALVETAVTSDTFTTDATANKNLMYVIEVSASDLDVSNSFDCFQVDLGTAVSSVMSVCFIMWNSRYAKTTPPSAIID